MAKNDIEGKEVRLPLSACECLGWYRRRCAREDWRGMVEECRHAKECPISLRSWEYYQTEFPPGMRCEIKFGTIKDFRKCKIWKQKNKG